MDNLIQIQRLHKIFEGETALYPLDVNIPAGKIVALAGPDGAGKTTLMRLITGLLLPTEGEVIVAGFNTCHDAQKIQEQIGYMPQKFGLYEDLSVIQNLNLYADLHGILGKEREEMFSKLLAFTQLTPFTKRLAGALSGGMKQKLGLSCALLSKPKLLLLDEPTVGVDPISRRELWKMVQELLKGDISVIWSTAYLDEAEKCDLVVLLNEGRMLYFGPPDHLVQEVKGKTFKLQKIQGSRRQVLSAALENDLVVDGVIQGADVRIVMKKRQPLDLRSLDGEGEILCIPTAPRFEDGFMDILGGSPKGKSILAESLEKIPQDGKVMIEADRLTKHFGSFAAAQDISFQVKRGEVFGLLGPNGAGKSTTFKMLCGLLKPTGGYAAINGVDLQKSSSLARSHIGYMAQKFSLYGGLSVLQNLQFFAGLYSLSGSRKKQAIEQMIEMFNFTHCLHHSAGTLPLGYKQRLALSCAMMHHPEVLFLDEPTSGVDPLMRREFWLHINGLVEKGTTVMLTTHFMDEAENCDRIGLVYQGKLITIGTPDELKLHVVSQTLPDPTLEDAFIALIERHDGGEVA